MVAGGMALATLLHVDTAKDNGHIRDHDIDLYIYGLSPADANRKAEEIHDVWAHNLPEYEEDGRLNERLVVKNAKTINLLSTYPNRRIQIVLKLLPSPTDVLLNFDLDACAIGYNGLEVFMLPRCARAIETGYSVFTMDLIWGHHLCDRRATQEARIFKYADRGFGIRFLPTCARCLEEDNLDDLFSISYPIRCAARLDPVMERTRRQVRNRKPEGKEVGLKTLKRIAYLGWDYTHQFYFGISPLALSPSARYDELQNQGLLDIGAARPVPKDDQDWQMDFNSEVRERKRPIEGNDQAELTDEVFLGKLMRFAELDADNSHGGLPDGRRGLGGLELFMRHCEAWRLNARADAK